MRCSLTLFKVDHFEQTIHHGGFAVDKHAFYFAMTLTEQLHNVVIFDEFEPITKLYFN
jgi:hypothetical protein